ncbi:MAG: hypothetical protein CL955_04630 [Erythrobacteraceae bacterium]|nr:hypothetical protein [Erythrobacteraceae bacterium]
MRLSQYIERDHKPQRARKAKSKKASIATHGLFLPILTFWGAALLGLAVIVLPEQMIGRMIALSNEAIDGANARFVFAAIAALLGGAFAFVVGGAWRSKALSEDNSRPITSVVNARRISPIDPANDLGSDSLDSPLEGMPFGGEVEDDDVFELTDETADAPRKPTLGELAERNWELEEPAVLSKKEQKKAAKKAKDEVAFTHRHFQSALIESCEGASCEASSASDAEAAAAAPRVLDLEEFGQLPNRNGVWVEDEAPAHKAESAAAVEPATQAPAPKSVRPLVPANALEKLRQKPTDELSMVEMVERFAGALHDHQQSERARRPDGGVGRDAALVEALKALTLFTEQGFDTGEAKSNASQLSETERELRNALAKLQTLRGAA